MVDLSVIIVSYNTKDFIGKCLESILDSIKGKLSYEVIVVDNASSDGSKDMIEKEFLNRHSGNQAPPEHPESLPHPNPLPKGEGRGEGGQARLANAMAKRARMTEDVEVIFIQNKKNLGFSAANNVGVKQARGRYLIFLNPDTIVYPNTLEIMVEFMDKHKDTGVATCKVVMPNGALDDASHRGFPTPWNSFAHFSGLSGVFPRSRLFGGYSLGWMDRNSTHEIDACAGAFMIVRREAGEEVGWWDEDYFFYGEDLDFCYRLKHGLSIYSSSKDPSADGDESRSPSTSSGQDGSRLSLGKLGIARTINKKWKIYYVPQVSILHYKGISGGIKKHSQHLTTADEETKLRATKARFDAMKIFYKKHYLDKYSPIITWLVFLGINVKLWFASKKV